MNIWASNCENSRALNNITIKTQNSLLVFTVDTMAALHLLLRKQEKIPCFEKNNEGQWDVINLYKTVALPNKTLNF